MPEQAPRTRCKFHIGTVERDTQHGEPRDKVNGYAVMADPGSIPEDQLFTKMTPMGQFSITIANPALLGRFKPGQQVYVDISPVPPPAPTD